MNVQDVEEQYLRLKENNPQVSKKQHRRNAFNRFVENLQKLDFNGARAFWKTELSNGDPVAFPTIPTGYSPRPDTVSTYNITFEPKKSSRLRTSSLIRAAWAITLSNYTSSGDVVFGALLSGRTGSSDDLAYIVGPTLTTVPVRASIDPKLPVVDYLQSIETKMHDAMPFEQLGLSKIRSIDAKVKAACDFQNLLVVQPADHSDIDRSILGRRLEKFIEADFDTYALTLECSVGNGGLLAKAIYDSSVIEKIQMSRIIRNFEHVLQQLCHEDVDKSILDINTISRADAMEIQRWNANVPQPMDTCVHHLVEKKMLQNPDAEAICSWDGSYTRGELDSVVSRLAQDLIDRGVGVGSKVPLFFNKSKWAIVGILAIIKAGAAFVPLDPRNPVARLISIVNQIDAKIIFCPTELGPLCSVSIPKLKTFVIDEASITQLSQKASAMLPRIQS